jgi:hypothetical protein
MCLSNENRLAAILLLLLLLFKQMGIVIKRNVNALASTAGGVLNDRPRPTRDWTFTST